MTRRAALFTAAGIVVVVLAAAAGLIVMRQLARQERLTRRLADLRAAHDTAAPAPAGFDGGGALLALVGRLGKLLAGSGLLPASTREELERSLANAGLRGHGAISLFVGFKVLLLGAGAGVGVMLAGHVAAGSMLRIALPLAGTVCGMLLPDAYVKSMRKRYLKQVEAGLPDALDMLVICTEAGLGFEPGLDRVAAEIVHAHPAIAEELRITATELRIIADRRQVLLNMGARTGLDSLRRLASTLVQTMQFGTPLSQALRTLATEMRVEALTRFEARAARLPVLLTVPMIVFILPCIFIIVGGPAALQLSATLGSK